MGFDIGDSVNKAADWISNAPIIRGIVNNPVFTALLIVSLVVIVVMALYHKEVKRAGAKRGARAFIYVFLIVLGVCFVHHYAVVRSAQKSVAQEGIRDVFSGIAQSRASPGRGSVPVLPMGYEGGRAAAMEFDEGDADGGRRPDNVAVGPAHEALSDLDIEDVVIPATTGAKPFRR